MLKFLAALMCAFVMTTNANTSSSELSARIQYLNKETKKQFVLTLSHGKNISIEEVFCFDIEDTISHKAERIFISNQESQYLTKNCDFHKFKVTYTLDGERGRIDIVCNEFFNGVIVNSIPRLNTNVVSPVRSKRRCVIL